MDGAFYVDSKPPIITGDIPQVILGAANKALVPIANLPLFPSNYFNAFVGKAVRMTLLGRMSTGTTPGTGTFSLLWGNGTDANGTNLGGTTALTLGVSQAALVWRVELIVRCRTLGGAGVGSLIVTGLMTFHPSLVASTLQPAHIPSASPAPVTVDLTAANYLSPQFLRSGSTAESMLVHEVLFEALN